MITEIYIAALLAGEKLPDQVWEAVGFRNDLRYELLIRHPQAAS